MFGYLACLIGLHKWHERKGFSWGEDVMVRECVRCNKSQRRFKNHITGKHHWVDRKD